MTLRFCNAVVQAHHTASWDSCKSFPALSEMPFLISHPLSLPNRGLTHSLIATQISHMCSYLFHCLLLSLMPIFTPSDRVFYLFLMLHLLQPDTVGLLSPLTVVSYFHFHVSAQFLSCIPLTVSSPDGLYLMQQSCANPLLLIPFYVTPQVTLDNVLFCS